MLWSDCRKKLKQKRQFEKIPNNLIEYSSAEGECNNVNRIHVNQKPVNLFRDLIKTYTNEGDTVFDGYAGSGTTCIACEMENRNYICTELDKDYYKAALKRLNDHKAQLNIFTNGEFAAI